MSFQTGTVIRLCMAKRLPFSPFFPIIPQNLKGFAYIEVKKMKKTIIASLAVLASAAVCHFGM